MIIAIRLCTHNTKVYSGMCGQVNWLCIFFFFSHIMWNLNLLDSDHSSTQTDIYLSIIGEFVGILIFRRKKVSINIIWWESRVCMCGEDELCLFMLSLIVEIRKWVWACARVNTGQ
jgi:hypothetical protein